MAGAGGGVLDLQETSPSTEAVMARAMYFIVMELFVMINNRQNPANGETIHSHFRAGRKLKFC